MIFEVIKNCLFFIFVYIHILKKNYDPLEYNPGSATDLSCCESDPIIVLSLLVFVFIY